MLTLTLRHPGHRIRVIYGSSGNKDAYACFQVLKDYAYKIHLVQAQHSRAKNLTELVEAVQQVEFELVETKEGGLFESIVEEGNIENTIDYALTESSKEDQPEVVVILGSFYIMAEARKYFKYNDIFDPVF